MQPQERPMQPMKQRVQPQERPMQPMRQRMRRSMCFAWRLKTKPQAPTAQPGAMPSGPERPPYYAP